MRTQQRASWPIEMESKEMPNDQYGRGRGQRCRCDGLNPLRAPFMGVLNS